MNSNSSNTLLALLAGSAIGVGLGILFAPCSGAKTRRKIRRGMDYSADCVTDKYNELSNQFFNKTKNAKNDLSSALDNLVSEGSYKAEEMIEQLESKLANLKSRIDQKK